MYNTGLVSVSFRGLCPDDIIYLARNAGLSCIEWGSDVHAPRDDERMLCHIAKEQEKAGLFCSSYGTYFTLGRDPSDQLEAYIRAAKILGTDTLRIWCGNKGYGEYTAEERASLTAEARCAAWIAENHGVRLCLECHANTYTDCPQGAREIMRTVNSPSFRMYWQPHQNQSVSWNFTYATVIAPFTVNIHVFNWKGKDRYPLADASELWRMYLGAFDGVENLLLEFMPDNDPKTLEREADSLRKIIKG